MDLKTLVLPLGAAWSKIVKCVPAIVAEVEKRMADGKIDPAERKEVALAAIDIIAAEFGLKLGFFAKLAISWLIDQIAKKLPARDIAIPAVVMGAVNTVI